MSDSFSSATERSERQRALRSLLVRPLLTASGPYAEEAALIRRHAGWLREWLTRYPGWSLQIDGEVARLRKTPADLSDGTRPARDPIQNVPFSRRRYVLFCLALAALERSDRQTVLGRLATDIVNLVSADPALAAAGIAFDLTSHDQRRDLVQVTRLLLDLEILIRVQGTEQQFLEERGDVLYNVNRPALSAALNVRRAPSSIDESDIDRRLALRAHLTRQLSEATGLVPEIRREGVAMVDDRGDATDIGLPEEGTEGHLTLLIAEFLAGHARRAPGVAVPMAAIYQRTCCLVDVHRSHWRKSVTQAGAETAATDSTIDRLVALRLAARTSAGVVPLPAIARYSLSAPIEARARAALRRS